MMNRISKLTQELQSTTKEAAGGGSMHEAMMNVLGTVAQEMGKYLGSKYKEAFTGFSTKAYNAGYMSMGSSAEIKNKAEPNRKGDIAVEASWDPRKGEYPTVRVWAKFPKAKEYSREIAFKLGESPTSAVKRLGPAFTRDLDYWITAVAKAYE